MPVAWPIWEGGDKIYDYSGSDEHATITNATWVGGRLQANANGEYAIGNYKMFNGAKGTIVMGYEPLTISVNNGIFGDASFGANTLHAYNNSSNRFYWRIEDSGDTSRYLYYNTSLTLNKKHDIALVYDDSNKIDATYYLGMYLDGKLLIPNGNSGANVGWSGTRMVPSGVNNFYIGDMYYNPNGKYNYFYIFDEVLNASQVNILRNNLYGMFRPIRWPIWNYSGVPGGIMAPYYYMNN
ncbi:MAG: hypothetical protein KAV87_30605 [Desulfobacteraceae bacterium]|nr:hypothetical protein [Desulfobacteraceae bacterium]